MPIFSWIFFVFFFSDSIYVRGTDMPVFFVKYWRLYHISILYYLKIQKLEPISPLIRQKVFKEEIKITQPVLIIQDFKINILQAEILEDMASVDEGDSDTPVIPPKQKKVKNVLKNRYFKDSAYKDIKILHSDQRSMKFNFREEWIMPKLSTAGLRIRLILIRIRFRLQIQPKTANISSFFQFFFYKKNNAPKKDLFR